MGVWLMLLSTFIFEIQFIYDVPTGKDNSKIHVDKVYSAEPLKLKKVIQDLENTVKNLNKDIELKDSVLTAKENTIKH